MSGNHETSQMSRTELFHHYKALYESGLNTSERPERLHKNDIKRLPSLFQRRDMENERARKEGHVDSLQRALENAGELDPVTVFPIGDSFYLIDGFHRLEAYRRSADFTSVPVEVFQGDFMEAWSYTFEANEKDKLPMTKQEKMQSTWDMVLTGVYTWDEMIAKTKAGKGTIHRMVKAKKHISEELGEGPSDYSWEDARDAMNGHSPAPQDDYREKQSREIARRLGKTFGASLTKYDGEVLWKAIELYSEQSARAIEDHLGIRGDGVDDDDGDDEF